ncbi:MAG: DUF3471 domain-containing protein, partial [Clostridiales bacterium]|nr:DUF3471 domain-containing protein [Clostridiales bacterium]
FLGITDGNWSDRFLEWQKKTQEAAGSQMEKMFGKPIEGTSTSHPLEDYTGVYHNECYGDITVTLEEGKLFFEFHHDRSELKHFHYDCFQLTSEESLLYEFVVEFLTEQKGTVDRIKFAIALDPSVPDEIFTKVDKEKKDE